MLKLVTGMALAVAMASPASAQSFLDMISRKDPRVCERPELPDRLRAGLRGTLESYGMRDGLPFLQITLTDPHFEIVHPDKPVVYCSTNVNVAFGSSSRTFRVMLAPEAWDAEGTTPLRATVPFELPQNFMSSMKEAFEEWRASRPAPFVPPR